MEAVLLASRDGIPTAPGPEVGRARPKAYFRPSVPTNAARARFERGDAGVRKHRPRVVEGEEAGEPDRGDRQGVADADAGLHPARIAMPVGELESRLSSAADAEHGARCDDGLRHPVDVAAGATGGGEILVRRSPAGCARCRAQAGRSRRRARRSAKDHRARASRRPGARRCRRDRRARRPSGRRRASRARARIAAVARVSLVSSVSSWHAMKMPLSWYGLAGEPGR